MPSGSKRGRCMSGRQGDRTQEYLITLGIYLPGVGPYGTSRAPLWGS